MVQSRPQTPIPSPAPQDIFLYINSPGGSVTAGMAIYDTMQFIKPNVATLCMGQACSMGAFLLAGGHPGKRYCLPNSRVMIHQPLGGFQGVTLPVPERKQEVGAVHSFAPSLTCSNLPPRLVMRQPEGHPTHTLGMCPVPRHSNCH